MSSIREQWRDAARMDQRQVCFKSGPMVQRGTTGSINCAISLVGGWTHFGARRDRQGCPVETCSYGTEYPSQLAVHLNNVHEWDWLTLANKFPPILPEDQP